MQFGWLAAFKQGAVTGGSDLVPEAAWWPHRSGQVARQLLAVPH